MQPDVFINAFRRRLQVPIFGLMTECPGGSCRRRLDALGDHLCTCVSSGRIRKRGLKMERAWVTVLSEAGARVATDITVQDHFPDTVHTDHRRLDLVAHGLATDGGLPVCADVTLRSPVTGVGMPKHRAHQVSGATFGPATREKESTYREYVRATHLTFRVLACEVGGRFSDTCRDWLAALASARVTGCNEGVADSKRALLLRGWWTILFFKKTRQTTTDDRT